MQNKCIKFLKRLFGMKFDLIKSCPIMIELWYFSQRSYSNYIKTEKKVRNLQSIKNFSQICCIQRQTKKWTFMKILCWMYFRQKHNATKAIDIQFRSHGTLKGITLLNRDHVIYSRFPDPYFLHILHMFPGNMHWVHVIYFITIHLFSPSS